MTRAIMIVGAAASGQAAVELARSNAARVTIVDD